VLLGGLDGCLDDLAVGLGGERDGRTAAPSTGCATDTVNVDLVGLWGLVVDDCVDAFDVETTRGDVCGEQEVNLAVAEGLNAGDTLGIVSLWSLSCR